MLVLNSSRKSPSYIPKAQRTGTKVESCPLYAKNFLAGLASKAFKSSDTSFKNLPIANLFKISSYQNMITNKIIINLIK